MILCSTGVHENSSKLEAPKPPQKHSKFECQVMATHAWTFGTSSWRFRHAALGSRLGQFRVQLLSPDAMSLFHSRPSRWRRLYFACLMGYAGYGRGDRCFRLQQHVTNVGAWWVHHARGVALQVLSRGRTICSRSQWMILMAQYFWWR